jgi:hypothetical protein
MAYAVKSDKIFKDFDNQMEAVKGIIDQYCFCKISIAI